MTENAYKKAGVDIEAGATLVEDIKPLAARTKRSGVMSGLGGFGAFFDVKAAGYKDPVIVSATDGVGTKLKIAIDSGIHDTVGIDLVAMCVNDLVVQGAEPLFFLDYFATGKLENGVAASVISGISEGCLQAGCALIGGETAEMPGMYNTGDYDLAGFSVGAVERDDILDGSAISDGDVILGLASSGVHSNGFSLVRKIVADHLENDFDAQAPFEDGKSMAQVLLTPTKIYVKPLLAALKLTDSYGDKAITGLAHITGGGLIENMPRVLPENMAVHLNGSTWAMPPVMRWMHDVSDLTEHDMLTTFNCGIGMAVMCKADSAAKVIETLRQNGETVFEIGKVVPRKGEAFIIDEAAALWS